MIAQTDVGDPARPHGRDVAPTVTADGRIDGSKRCSPFILQLLLLSLVSVPTSRRLPSLFLSMPFDSLGCSSIFDPSVRRKVANLDRSMFYRMHDDERVDRYSRQVSHLGSLVRS